MKTSDAPRERPPDGESLTREPLDDGVRLELADMLSRCGKSLLETHGVDAERAETPDVASHGAVLAFIGFFGDGLRGTLVVDACRALLARSYPACGHAPDDDDLIDWSGELANLLLGRLKSELLGCGVAIRVGTPAVVSGEAMAALDSLHPVGRVTCRFEAQGAWMRARLEVTAEARFSLEAGDTFRPSAPAPQGGDAFLFD
jgi:CheY-specific phosphatase CheX